MKEKFKQLIERAFFEEKEVVKTIKYKDQKEFDDNVDKDIEKIINKELEDEKKHDILVKRILTAIPLVVIIIFYIYIYFSYQERFKDISYFEFMFKYSEYFYVFMATYFAYLIILEVRFLVKYRESKIDKLFIFFTLVLCSLAIYIILFNVYQLYFFIFPILISIATMYLYIRWLINRLNNDMGDLV